MSFLMVSFIKSRKDIVIMKVGLIQLHSVPEDVEGNFCKGIMMFHEAVKKGADFIAFPELWTCGYYLETEGFLNAEKMNIEIIDTFKTLSKENHVVTLLPLPIKENEKLYIGMYLIESNGEIIAEYHKSFLWGREQNYFVHGERDYRPVDTSVGRLGLLICYDMEFSEPSRILAKKGAQMIVAPSVWSIPAENRWQIQYAARALDNTVFVCGINNVGEGACGETKVVGPMGNTIAEASKTEEEVLVCDIDFSTIDEARKIVPYLEEYDDNLFPGGIEKVRV